MKLFPVMFSAGALAALSACTSSDATTVRLSNVWNTTCGAGGQNVVISAPTMAQFHAAVEKTAECQRGYTAVAPTR